MSEENPKPAITLVCEQKPPCDGVPFARMFWPGDKARVLCQAHAIHAQRIAGAIGLHLVVEEL